MVIVWERVSKVLALLVEENVPRMEAPRVARSRAMARSMPLEAPLESTLEVWGVFKV